MSSDSDALEALRNAVKSGSTISYTANNAPTPSLVSATHISLSPSITLPKSQPTRWRKPGVSAASGPSDYLSLEAVYLAWLLKDAPGAEYMKQVRENGLTVGFVSVTERKSVVDWLEGRISEHDRIEPLSDTTTPPGTPVKGSAQLPSTTSHRPTRVPETSSPTKRKYVVDMHDVEIVKKFKQSEVELKDRNTVLRGKKPTDFKSTKDKFAAKLKTLKEASKPGVPTPSASAPDPKMQARKAKNMYPIIMISSSPTALITMHNVKKFLQESSFEPSQEARARAAAEGNTKSEDLIPIYRKRTHIDSAGKEMETQARYFVVDSVEALGKFGADAWDRVVCVMTTGQTWQFKPYKWTEPTQLFHHVKGIYVAWANDPPNPKISDWNVTSLKIEPHRRHVDKSVVAHFWKILDGWILANKPWLMKG